MRVRIPVGAQGKEAATVGWTREPEDPSRPAFSLYHFTTCVCSIRAHLCSIRAHLCSIRAHLNLSKAQGLAKGLNSRYSILLNLEFSLHTLLWIGTGTGKCENVCVLLKHWPIFQKHFRMTFLKCLKRITMHPSDML